MPTSLKEVLVDRNLHRFIKGVGLMARYHKNVDSQGFLVVFFMDLCQGWCEAVPNSNLGAGGRGNLKDTPTTPRSLHLRRESFSRLRRSQQ